MATNSSVQWRSGNSICRCCLSEGCYKDISTEYFWMGKREVYSEMLAETFDLCISFSKNGGPNSNSRLICEACISRLRDAAEFKRQVKDCEKTFVQLLEPGSSQDTSTVGKEIKKELKLENLFSDDDDDDFLDDTNDFGDDDLDDEPLMKLASKTPKKEPPVQLKSVLSKGQIGLKRKAPAPVVQSKSTPPKKVKIEVKKVSATTSSAKNPEKPKKGSLEQTPNGRRVVPLFQVEYDRTLCKPLGTITDFSKVNHCKFIDTNVDNEEASFSPMPETACSPSSVLESSVQANSDLQYTSLEPIPKKIPQKQPDIREHVVTIFEYTTVYPFIYGNNKFKCFVCSLPFLDATVLRTHMNESHTLAPVKRLLNNRNNTMLKVDISVLQCKLCSYESCTFHDLKKHLFEHHQKSVNPSLQDNLIPFKLVNEENMFDCALCTEQFIKFRPLVIHMSVHFSNYSCEICGSGFMTLRLLKKHLEVHENGNFPCESCDKVFTTAHKKSIHVRGVHLKQNPRICPMCPERFNSNYRRMVHLQDVHNQSTKVHKCETCGRSFHLKYHLVCHVRSVHLQERNQQCDVCHQRFCNKETLKRHMVIHTGEKNYKCDVCHSAFLRRKNLRDHLRLHNIAA